MTTRVFTDGYAEHVTLRDGTQVVLRLVRPDDKDLLRRGFERWSPQSRYARFLVPKHRLTDEELRYLCEVDQESHFALGAIRGGDSADDADSTESTDTLAVGLAIARFIRLPQVVGEPVTAEAAIAVADEAQGIGLGRILFQRLVAAAAERGIERFRCEVLGSNAMMKSLIDHIAPQHTTEVGGGVMSIDFPIPAASTDEERAESAMYRLFRAAAEGGVEWTDAVRRFWRQR
jgi:ribosomal protein S18 acetylase RimI-like enzyme